MRCSFIVSAYDRPAYLRCALSSLEIQTCRDHEVIVVDNAVDPTLQQRNESVTAEFSARDPRFRYLYTGAPSCYHSSEIGADHAGGEYLCFPSDDGYYIPSFLERMLSVSPAGIIHCDCLYGHRTRGYFVLQSSLRVCRIDKGGFLIRRELFYSVGRFKTKVAGRCNADGDLAEAVKRSHARECKIPGILWTHNP